MPIPAWAYLVGAGITGLAGYLGAEGQVRAGREARREGLEAARERMEWEERMRGADRAWQERMGLGERAWRERMEGVGREWQERMRAADWARQERIAEERRARAGAALAGYGFTPRAPVYQPFAVDVYRSPFEEQQRAVLAEFLRGGITPAQEAILAHQRQLGEEGIARAAAGRGMPGGAQAALAAQLGRDIGLGAAEMGMQRQLQALQMMPGYEQMWERRFLMPQQIEREERLRVHEYGLADFLRREQARMRQQELLAQLA